MDIVRSFTLANGLCRGCLIAADQANQEIWQRHSYPECLKPFLEQAVVLVLALSAGIKFQGKFALQITSEGPIKLLYAEATHDKKVRAYMTFNQTQLPQTALFRDYFINAQLMFSVSQPGCDPYQSFVQLKGDSLTAGVLDYLRVSEQIQTDIVIKTDSQKTRVLFLQKMPDRMGPSDEQDADTWETLSILMQSVQTDELLSDTLPDTEVLRRLFHAHELVVAPAKTPMFDCSCKKEKMLSFFKQLPHEQIEKLCQEGFISAECEFCGKKYRFSKEEII